VSGRAESVREALDQRVPALSEQLEYTVYLRALHESFVAVLSSPVDVMRSNPYFFYDSDQDPSGVQAMRTTRAHLVSVMLEHAEAMSEPSMAQANSGWTLFMLTWCVVGQLSLALERVRVRAPRWVDGEILERNEVLTSSGGVADVPRMSMLELREAMDVLRARMYMLDTIDAAFLRYVLALEHRAAQFAHQTASGRDNYDCKLWLRKDGTVTHGFMATMAWWFVWLKRHCRWYLNMSAPNFFGDRKDAGRIVRIDSDAATPDRRYVTGFLINFSATLNTVDHRKEFMAVAKHYEAMPGDLEVHSYVYGMGGIEQATVQDIVSRCKTPEATSYVGLRKHKRDLSEWLHSQSTRERLTGRGRFVGGGASCEAFIEQLAVLHTFDQLFVAKLQLRWARWFVVLLMPMGAGFEDAVKRGIVRGLPFIVQRAGRFGCVVPRLPEGSLMTRNTIERRLGLDDGTCYQSNAAVLYDGTDAYDAITVWSRFMLDGWGGRVDAANKRCAPLLRRILSPPHTAAASSSSSMASLVARANVVRMRV